MHIFALIALGGFIALGSVARADDTPATPAPAAGADTNAPAGHAGRGAQMDKLFTAISATDTEKEQLKPIFKERNEKLKALRDDTSLSQEDKKDKRKEIMEGVNAKVKGVVTADQYTQYLAFMKEQRGQRGKQPPAN